ncbi:MULTISPECIES: hypothetical protein [Paenibacillus]|uniref:hypothetical protein n=1 Tax=Paenibacillus TaxID=44249 RepID=UPI00096D9348|nr:hypothetical protein [Paenibacillus odorifer]OMD57972.1 hypothetical protein BSK55_14865 [Paenibacillus odorifer]
MKMSVFNYSTIGRSAVFIGTGSVHAGFPAIASDSKTEQLKRKVEMGAFASAFSILTLVLISWNARKEKVQETERISKLSARYYRLALDKGKTILHWIRKWSFFIIT